MVEIVIIDQREIICSHVSLQKKTIMKDTQWYRNHNIQGRYNILLLSFKEEKERNQKLCSIDQIFWKTRKEESPQETNENSSRQQSAQHMQGTELGYL